jgi:glycosyltransferase involved in cell wall biosynthesis
VKKVLHVITDTNIGGAGRYLLNLLVHSDPARYELAVACPGGGELIKEIRNLSVKVFELEGGERSFSLQHLKALRRIISQEGFDIVHTHASFSGRVAGKLAGKRVVFTRHGVGMVRKDPAYKFATLASTRIFTDAVISVSRAVKVSLIEMGTPAKMIKTIHNGIDLTGYDHVVPTLRKKYSIPPEEKIIGTVARLVPEKGCEFGIKAMPLILEKHPNARLVIVGEGFLRQSLEELSRKLGIADKVMFLGYQRNVEELIADFDVFMMPSLTEGLSLALLEVMALGKPVVATEVGGNPEVIRSGINGILVPSKDERALAQEVAKLLSSPKEARELGIKARETVVNNFNAELMASRTLDVYDEILRKAGRL